jgi:hypothetical protein
MTCWDDVKRTLSERVELARAGYEAAHIEFKQAIAEIPSSLPPPDGTGRIRIAGESYRWAMRAYSDALREFNEFMMHRQIPDWLKNDGKAGAGGAAGSSTGSL